ncbi:MAG: phosphotransferase family protein [Acidimicrobiales bacterium]|jgi:aminoglycoside phosphotransferase (APT) family kinase protein
MDDDSELSSEMRNWIASETGAVHVVAERRSAGGSRAGYAVDIQREDGVEEALWLRMDLGYGPLSNTPFTLRREASVYRALQGTDVRIPSLVAVHPTQEAFLMHRIEGRNWFSEIKDPERAVAIASDFMAQVAGIHRIDPRTLHLSEFDPQKPVSAYVEDEIDIWERVHLDSTTDREPIVLMAAAWLRCHVPDDTGTSVVFVQGDTGPGNFMYKDDHVAVVLDWENAHFGDFHDDLAWIYVRDLQERFTYLPDRLADYERQSGNRVDVRRLRYFIVLAQMRCAVGTLNALAVQDARGEMANHLIYSALHLRMLAEALAGANEIDIPDPEPLADECPATAWTWLYEVALQELREVVVPGLAGNAFANRRAKGVARMVKVLEENDRLGDAVEKAELADLRTVLGAGVQDIRGGRSKLCQAVSTGSLDELEGIRYGLRYVNRRTELLRTAMGDLANRHYSPVCVGREGTE